MVIFFQKTSKIEPLDGAEVNIVQTEEHRPESKDKDVKVKEVCR